MASTAIVYDGAKMAYRVNGKVINDKLIIGAADAVVTEVRGRIAQISDQLALGKIDVEEWYYAMKVNSKMLAGAERALAVGGWDNMKASDWDKASDIALEQWEGKAGKFPGLRRMAEDVVKGRYGKGELTSGFLSRANSYADAGHGHYVNARMDDHNQQGYRFAERLRGDLDSCPDCIAWAALGKIPIEEMENNYPISSSVCGVNCGCEIAFYKN